MICFALSLSSLCQYFFYSPHFCNPDDRIVIFIPSSSMNSLFGRLLRLAAVSMSAGRRRPAVCRQKKRVVLCFVCQASGLEIFVGVEVGKEKNEFHVEVPGSIEKPSVRRP
jgi:hypothetical protein